MNRFESDGYAILPDLLSREEVQRLSREMETHATQLGKRAGARGLARDVPIVRAVQRDPRLVDLATEILGAPAFVVRTLFFDKTPQANWKVAWHQDLTICVRERREVSDFGPWSVKEGIHHVQPPTAILERMVTLRLHLDDCDAENGALRVIPGSHREGRLAPDAIQERVASGPEVVCEVPAGGVLIMRPLILHASSPAVTPRHRRVLHLEWAAAPLPGGLLWCED